MANNLSDCFCSLAEMLGGAKSQVIASLDGMIGLLSALKALLQLINFDLEDEIRKIAYTAALEILKTAGAAVETPFAIVLGYTRILSDCPPVASLAKVLKDAKAAAMGPLDNLEYQINQYLAALEDKKRQIAEIDRWIALLQEAREKLELCGS